MATAVSSSVREASVESSDSAVEWGAVTAGALAAMGLTIILLTLGSGLGLATVSPWSFAKPALTTFGITAGIWLIVMQWLSSALGGYLTGRLRKKWVGIRTNEIAFRDIAHGFLSWALATVIIAAVVAVVSVMAAAGAAPTDAPGASNEAAEQARRVAVQFAAYSSLSFMIGAAIGSLAGALGGYHRDAV